MFESSSSSLISFKGQAGTVTKIDEIYVLKHLLRVRKEKEWGRKGEYGEQGKKN